MSKPVLQLRAPPAQVLRALDKAQRRLRAAAYAPWRGVLFSLVALLAACVAVGVLGPPGFVTGLSLFVGFGASGTLLLVGIAAWTQWRQGQAQRAVDDNLRRSRLVRVVLQRLQRDMAPDTPVDLRLRLVPLPDGPGSRTHPRYARSKSPEDLFDRWLTLETRLADGTHLRLRIVEWRRGRSRKSGKLKVRDWAALDVQLRVKAKRHPGLAMLTEARALQAVRLPRGATRPRLQLSADRLRLRVRLDGDWKPEGPREDSVVETAPGKVTGTVTVQGEGSLSFAAPPGFTVTRLHPPDASRAITMMLLSLYQMLHLARPESHGKARRRRPSV